MNGYLTREYVQSFSELGTMRSLHGSGGWLLERQIPGTHYHDAIGCYPLFTCKDWSQLHADIENIGKDLISLSLVTDPFGDYDTVYLNQCFKEVVIPFKEHFVVDLSCPMNTFVSSHHHRYARKAFKNVYVERYQNPELVIDDWVKLYATLIERRSIKGILKFSKSAFAKQLRVPGIIVFRAMHEKETVGMLLWYVQGEVGYYHLGAYSSRGYELRASFALFWYALEYFAAIGLRWLNLGAGAGASGNDTDGLTRFKQGWSTSTRSAYFCGRIFDKAKYLEIVKVKNIPATDYFPAYRQGEF